MKKVKLFTLLVSLSLLSHCTQLRKASPLLTDGQFANTGNLSFIRNITYGTFQTETQSLKLYNNYLLVAGKPFGFMVMDVTNPLNPVKVFAAKEYINNFTQNLKFGAWIPDYYANGAIEVFGSMMLTSGSYGASLFSVASLGAPVEKNRFPPINDQGVLTQDPRFMYNAIVANSQNQNLLYGITMQDGIYYLNGSATNLSIASFQPFNQSGPVCCTKAAAQFGGKLFIARTHDLVFYDINASNGQLSLRGNDDTMAATYIAQTPSHLYVQSQFSNSKQDGIYVYDSSLNLVNFFPLIARQFVVTSDDRFIIANIDNTSLRVYQIY